MRSALLEGIYRVVRRRAWWVLLGAASLSLAALFYIRDLPMRSSFLDLLPQGDPLVITFQEREEIITRSDALSIVLRVKDPQDPTHNAQRLQAVAERLSARLREHPEIVSVSYTKDIQTRRGDELLSLQGEILLKLKSYQERLRQLLPASTPPTTAPTGVAALIEHYRQINTELRRILLGPELDLRQLRFNPADLIRRLDEFKALNESVQAAFEQAPARIQATDKLLTDVLATVNEIQAIFDEILSFPQELNLSQDGTKLLVNVRPRQSSQHSLEYNRALTRFVRETLQNAQLEEEGVTWGIGGPYVLSAETNLQLNIDMRNTTIISAIGVFLVITLTLRQLFYPLLALIVLFLALIVTLAWAKFATNGLNLVTSFLPALIVGLGIDYGINFIAHFSEMRRAGARFEAALKAALLHKGNALVTASLATACVLFALMLATSPGLYEMGIIAGVGVLVALLATLVILPALMIVTLILRRRREGPSLAVVPALVISPRYETLWRWARWPITLGVLLGSLFMLQQALHVGFRFADEDLAPQELPAREIQREVRRDFEMGSAGLGEYFLFFTPNVQELRRVVAALEEIQSNGLIDSVRSIAMFLSEDEQSLEGLGPQLERDLERARAELDRQSADLRLLQELAEEIARLKANITEVIGKIEFFALTNELRRLQEELQALTQQLEAIEERIIALERQQGSLEELQMGLERLRERLRDLVERLTKFQQIHELLAALPKELQERFVTPEGEFVIYVHLKRETINEPEIYRRFIQQIQPLGVEYLGYAMIQESLEKKMQRDFQVSTLAAAAIIIVILGVSVGWRWAIVGVLPVGLGFLWMLGAMRLSGIDFNFANIIISSLLIGNGVDYAVYLIHGFQEERSIGRAWRLTALPILGSALTTMVSFGSLLLAATPGLRVFGLSALYGVGFTALFTLFFLPAVLAFIPVAKRD
ncbi:MAG: MMPL family transporter [Candidatus Bipolaricaulota bacterium]|nr:MMPL family transporter [Candidatus Bipolaricaulota bacterium]MCS7273919.1 MMPL family transporter [Candidatus Bipolaricaulota bacterium]MDW8110794.1 MMPL family transporter [Candidatus Bipolaricaulota bacterium]MDW8328725.1 MMPL family transporter [Candidatus Bipolaricaulota bacterium]